MSEKNEWKQAEALRESLLWTASSLAAVGKEQDVIVLEGRKRTIGEILDEANAALDAPSAPGDAQDAARWRFIRRKLCLTGNGDGTCAMHAINLPASIQGWPEPGPAVAEFCDAAIDAALAAQASGQDDSCLRERITELMDTNRRQQVQIKTLEAQIHRQAQDAADAARYRWLRDREIPEVMDLWHQNPARIDAAIDAAMKASA